ncbi:PSD1 and planctomycete cytochrome C domain-containing protein [Pirellulales bacterium]|nr:PSD1 and planctomycete cytochrome C domain-containing protein [Pirellulales bacterium]MDB4365886.1 PSD1 and planctomycete cytochrome C domain-containing protein [Pirellulales bacterium]
MVHNFAGWWSVVPSRSIFVGFILSLIAWSSLSAVPAISADPLSFTCDIKGLLSNRCIRCHGPDAEARHGGGEDGLRLDTFDGATEDLRGYAAIVPGDADKSELIIRVTAKDTDLVMPPPEAGETLSADEVTLLRRWINGGAEYEPHWSYTRISRPMIPMVSDLSWPRNQIDRFILAKLEAEDLEPSQEADRMTLSRRLALDLTGLPIAPEQVDKFVADVSTDAFKKFVDTLLSHPGYGEHMARSWLDLARYADSAGYADDPPRTIWPYRDWVIRAFDTNMPFDDFTVKQLAGDLLLDTLPDNQIATAFHRNTLTNNEGGTIDEEFRSVAVVDRVNTTLSTWMGTTIACAQCHDHKYDPLSQQDFFGLYAIFNNTADADRKDESPLVSIPWEPVDAKRRPLEKELAAILKAVPEMKKITPKKQVQPRGEPPELRPLRKHVDALRRRIAGVKAVTVPVMEELQDDKRRVTKLQYRGNWQDLGPVIEEHIPAVFRQPELADGQRVGRLKLAEWLVDQENPLTARVIVNRLWEQIFGIGIVSTSEEFGSQGELPSHPELLDWLACEFIDSGWDIQAIQRLIVTSATYRQSSKPTPELLEHDPENRLLACGPRVRLSAEVIRDQALAAAGLLSLKKGGPSVHPPQPDLGLKAAFGAGIDWKTSAGEDRYRRAIYTTWRRSNPYPSMATFDAPNREVCTIRRPRTNTPLQALVTLNDPVFVEAAQALARRIILESEANAEAQATRGFRLVLTREPRPNEVERLVKLYEETHTQYMTQPGAAMAMATKPRGLLPEEILKHFDGNMNEAHIHLAAWTVVGNVLLNLDETFMCP